MKRCLTLFTVLFMTVAFADQSTFDRYTPNTLHAIIEAHQSDAQGTDVLISARDFASRVPVVYEGSQRPIPVWRRDFLDKYFKSRKLVEYRKLFESEILVKEGNRDHWLPIQKPLLAAFDDEVKKDAEVTLLVSWLGAVKHDDRYEWVFTVNDFISAKAQ